MPQTVLLVGSLDTKSAEYDFVRGLLEEAHAEVLLLDTSVLGEPGITPDIRREEVAAAGGQSHAELVAEGDRGHALQVMAKGAAKFVGDLHAAGRIDGAMALGGTGGTSVAAAAFRQLPVGFPKLVVSTAASGNTEPYVRETDLILVPSIVDIAGLNRISMRVLSNAAAAMAGMVLHARETSEVDRPLVAATMFGVTTPCVQQATVLLEDLGYEVVVFHMTGTGGRALESLIRQGFFAGVLDVTTTELADHLVGGVFDAGEDRLTAAAETRIPQVVSVGALDMVNFGTPSSVPEQFRSRRLYEHNASVTLMRTTPHECYELGLLLGRKVAEAGGPTTVFLPLRGVSAIAVEGGPFHDPEADARLFEGIRETAGGNVDIVELDTDVNSPEFASATVEALHYAMSRIS